MNLCYCDESGTGNEAIAVMAGIVVDAGRMHLTKAWVEIPRVTRVDGPGWRHPTRSRPSG